MKWKTLITLLIAVLAFQGAARAHTSDDESGRIAGTVTLGTTDEPLHGARVLLIELGRSTLSDEQGRYAFDRVPAGTYSVIAVREHLQAVRATVEVVSGETTTLDLSLLLSAVHEEVTVTATGRQTTPFDAFNTVQVLDSIDLAQNMAPNLGGLLEGQPNIAKRSFGPGSSRPIIRGFDNDRVLIMQDGIRTGDLSSQSGDHGVTIDPGSIERVEILKGPATLLYGSSAIGGVVNTISPQEQFYRNPPRELRGQITGDLASTDDQIGINANFQYGSGDLMVWFGGGARRTHEYDTPEGRVQNSETESKNGRVGIGWFGDRGWLGGSYQIEDGRYGVPFAGEIEAALEGEETVPGEGPFIDLDTRREVVRIDAGLREIDSKLVDSVKGIFTYTDYHHDEIEERTSGGSEIGTSLDSTTSIGRIEVTQQPLGRLSGQFGLWGLHRSYVATGEEALAPPTRQNALAGFAYQELGLAAVSLQFGARLETNAYSPEPRPEADFGPLAPLVRDRTFTGLSGSVGIRIPMARRRIALVASLSSAYRAPALEELYNYGPHVGNLSFEIGNPNLSRERSNGGELSLRLNTATVHGSFNVFYYDIQDFIFAAPTGAIRDGLVELEMLQSDSRFLGFDGSFGIHLHPRLELRLGGGLVDARLTDTDEHLPRIPPASGRLAVDWSPSDRLHLRPELVATTGQHKVFGGETPTDGYALVNFMASYTLPGAKAMQVITLNFTNLGDRLYRNHTSFIKELAPEAGRRLLLTYTVRLF